MELSASKLDSFQRFERLRELANQRQEIRPAQDKLAQLIESKKQSVFGIPSYGKDNSWGQAQNINAPKLREEIESGIGQFIHKGLSKANDLLMYDEKINKTSFTDGSKKLGNYIDLVG